MSGSSGNGPTHRQPMTSSQRASHPALRAAAVRRGGAARGGAGAVGVRSVSRVVCASDPRGLVARTLSECPPNKAVTAARVETKKFDPAGRQSDGVMGFSRPEGRKSFDEED